MYVLRVCGEGEYDPLPICGDLDKVQRIAGQISGCTEWIAGSDKSAIVRTSKDGRLEIVAVPEV